MLHRYLFEIETKGHRFVMRVAEGHDSDTARKRAMSQTFLRVTGLIACDKRAPEFGDTCNRELVE